MLQCRIKLFQAVLCEAHDAGKYLVIASFETEPRTESLLAVAIYRTIQASVTHTPARAMEK